MTTSDNISEAINVILERDLQTAIVEQMEASFPNEAGGFLLGEIAEQTVTIKALTQVENIFDKEEQYHRYAMTPQDWMRLEDEADEKGLVLLGYYHSHPDSPAIPSEYDREHALPNFTYIITSVMAGKAANMRVWRLAQDRNKFYEGTIEVI